RGNAGLREGNLVIDVSVTVGVGREEAGRDIDGDRIPVCVLAETAHDRFDTFPSSRISRSSSLGLSHATGGDPAAAAAVFAEVGFNWFSEAPH
ncbi:MAG: hypothetical protein WB239_09685, partial [Acidimicrobiia bacterium]